MPADLSQALSIVALSDTGHVRPHNEDSVFVDAVHGLAIIADGMGGYNAGEVASGMATELLGAELVRRLSEDAASGRARRNEVWNHEVLELEIAKVNDIIYQAALTQPNCAGMGTTLVMALFHDDRMTVAHLGDSRLYRLRGDEFQQITRDHSLLQEQVDSGMLTVEQARLSRHKNLVTRALGVDPVVEPEVHDYEMRAGDIYLLCSDGLTDMVDEEDIAMAISSQADDVEACADHLVDLANDNGGRDNITVVLVRIKQAYPAARGWWARLKAWFR